jgi:hypothetical protein
MGATSYTTSRDLTSAAGATRWCRVWCSRATSLLFEMCGGTSSSRLRSCGICGGRRVQCSSRPAAAETVRSRLPRTLPADLATRLVPAARGTCRQGVLRVGDYWSAEFLRDPRPASCDPTRSPRWRDPTAPAPESCSSSTTERGASTRTTRSSGATTPSLLGHNGRRKLFCTLDGRTLKQLYSGAFCGGWPTRLGVETGFSRIRYVTAAR